MKFANLVSKFKKVEEPAAAQRDLPAQGNAAPSDDVVLAGKVLNATRDTCSIDINGAQYDITPGDITDVQLLASALAGKPDAPVKEVTSNDIVLLTISGKVNLCRRVVVPATLVAAAGTWLTVAPNPEAPAEKPAS